MVYIALVYYMIYIMYMILSLLYIIKIFMYLGLNGADTSVLL